MERWTVLPLSAVATEVRDTVNPSVLGDSEVDHFAIPVLDATGRPETVAANEILSSKQRLRGGEVMISRLNPRKARVVRVPAELPRAALASGEFVVLEPRRIEPRFLTYFLLADTTLQELDSRVNSVTRSHQRIRPEVLLHLPVATPPREEQRAIADFLDVETARIDALIDKKRRLITLLEERFASHAAQLLEADEHVELRRIAELLPGFTFPSDSFSAGGDGPRLLRGINVAVRAIRWDDVVYLTASDQGLDTYRLRAGDVVVGMDRPFISGGTRVAAVDDASVDSLLVQRVCRIRPKDRDWSMIIRETLSSDAFRAHVEADMTGVSVPHISEFQIATMSIPLIPDDQVARTAERLRRTAAATASTKAKLTAQIALLEEKRRALITAAVTGEFAVPGSAAA